MTQDDEKAADAPVSAEPTALPPPEREPASGVSPGGAPMSAGLKGFLGGLLGGLVILLLAAAGLAAAWPSLHDVLLADENRRLGLAERAVDDLNPRLSAVERQQKAGADVASAVQALTQRLDALESQIRTPTADPRVGAVVDQASHLASEVTRLDGEIQALRRAMPPEGTILRLAERADAAERAAREIAAQHASAQALLLVVGQLREAVDRGDPYQSELQAAHRVATPETAVALDSLAPHAAAGIPRKETLTHQFPKLTEEILHASIVPPEGGFWQRALAKLTALITIRRSDGQGDSPAAIVSRAEAGVADGDLARAAQELSSLKDAPLQVAKPWIDAAVARTNADRALSEISATAAAQTAKSGG